MSNRAAHRQNTLPLRKSVSFGKESHDDDFRNRSRAAHLNFSNSVAFHFPNGRSYCLYLFLFFLSSFSFPFATPLFCFTRATRERGLFFSACALNEPRENVRKVSEGRSPSGQRFFSCFVRSGNHLQFATTTTRRKTFARCANRMAQFVNVEN